MFEKFHPDDAFPILMLVFCLVFGSFILLLLYSSLTTISTAIDHRKFCLSQGMDYASISGDVVVCKPFPEEYKTFKLEE